MKYPNHRFLGNFYRKKYTIISSKNNYLIQNRQLKVGRMPEKLATLPRCMTMLINSDMRA